MNYIFLDTNVLIHYKPFNQIKWEKLFHTNYKIVIAAVVLAELDKHRRTQNKRISNTAKNIIKEFESIIEAEVPSDIIFLHSRPKKSIFTFHSLDKGEQDDNLLASIIELSEIHNEDKVFLVTDDIGLKLKAKSLNILTKKLPEEFQLPPQEDELEIKIKKLTREIAELKSRIPKVDLYFKGKKKFWEHKMQRIRPFDEISKEMMSEIKGKHLPMNFENNVSPEKGLSALLGSELFGISQDRIQEYNNELQNYFKDYEQYIKGFYQYGLNNFLSIELPFEIFNDGNTPAEDIDLCIHFPDGFELFEKGEFNKKPKEPEVPIKPRSIFERGALGIPMPHIMPNRYYEQPKPQINSPSIKKTNSYEVDMSCNNLKHTQSYKFPILIVKYPSFEKMVGFELEYKLMIGNVPFPIEGTLQVSVVN